VQKLFFCSLLLLLAATCRAASLEQQLDQYLEMVSSNPPEASAFLIELERQDLSSVAPTAKARLWLYLATDFAAKQAIEQTLHYFSQVAELADQTQNPDIRADLLAHQLDFYWRLQQKEKTRAITPELAQALHFASNERVVYLGHFTLGQVYEWANRLEEALQAYQKAYQSIETSKHPRTKGRLLSVKLSIARINTSLAYQDKALALLNEGIDTALTEQKYHELLPDYYLAKGILFIDQNLYPAAEQAYQQGLQWAEKLQNKPIASLALNNLGDLRMRQQRYADASEYFNKALTLANEMQDKGLQATASFNLGFIAVRQEDFANGLPQMSKMVEQAAATGLPDTDMLKMLAELADAYGMAGQHQEESKYLRQHQQLSQQVFNKAREEQINALQESFATAQKTRQIEDLQHQNQLKTAELEQKKLQQSIILLFGAVVLLGSVLLLLLYRKVRSTNQQLKQANAQLAYNSLHDPLTGLLNRRSLQDYMQKKMQQGERRQATPAVTDGFILLDIDHFKHINDHYSHDAGDAVLVELSRRLRTLTRQGDMLLRWGGEEFLIVLRGINQSGLTNFTNRVLQAIGQTPVSYQQTQIPVYASAGFLLYPFAGLPEQALGWEKTLHLADMALYLSKVHGRNRAYGLIDLHRPYAELQTQLESDLSVAIEKGELEITLVLGPPHH
jgi:diguanylate cyclase (GGDEF)-like protein